MERAAAGGQGLLLPQVALHQVHHVAHLGAAQAVLLAVVPAGGDAAGEVGHRGHRVATLGWRENGHLRQGTYAGGGE